MTMITALLIGLAIAGAALWREVVDFVLDRFDLPGVR